MISKGRLIHKEVSYDLEIRESTESKRIDISRNGKIITSILEKIQGTTDYYGSLDLWYVFSRITRDARTCKFPPENIEVIEDFELGVFIYEVKQKDKRVEFSYRNENQKRKYTYMKTPEGEIEYTQVKEESGAVRKVSGLTYQELKADAPEVDQDRIMMSKMLTLAELKERFDLSWLEEKDYRWISTLEELQKYVDEALSSDELVMWDTETTGLDIYNYRNSEDGDQIVSIVFNYNDHFTLYVPLGHKYEENLPIKEALEILRPILETKPGGAHGGRFDLKVFLKYGIKLNIVHDTLTALFMIEPDPRKGSKGLKENVDRYFGIKQLALTDIFPNISDKKIDIRFDLVGKDLALAYACPDVDLLRPLLKNILSLVPDIARELYNVEIGILPIVADAEFRGIRIDMEQFEREAGYTRQIVEKLRELIYKLAGYKLNLESNQQVGKLLYEDMGCEKIITSKTNPSQGSTQSKALKYLSNMKLEKPREVIKEDIIQTITVEGEGAEKRTIIKKKELDSAQYPIVNILRKYRDYSKLLTSFFNKLEKENTDGRLFSWINPNGAATARIITPFQTYPEFVKKLIIGDTDEHVMFSGDYRQIELRIMFGLAGETEMIELSDDPDNDIHRIVSAGMNVIELWQITKSMRDEAKAVNFGIPYSLGIRSLAESLRGLPVTPEKVQFATEARRRYFSALEKVERLFIDFKQMVRDWGFITTKWGRYRGFGEIMHEHNPAIIGRILRQAGNYPIQAFCADIFKTAMIRFQKRIEKRGWHKEVPSQGESYPLVRQALFVHDANVGMFNYKHVHPAQVIYEFVKAFQFKLPGFPTFFVGLGIARSWGEADSDHYQLPTLLMEEIMEEVENGLHTEPIDNPIEWTYQRIVDFNRSKFKNYFDELKDKLTREGKEINSENLSVNFRHNVLTHDLLAMYKIPDDLRIQLGREVTHEDQIEYCAKKYIEEYGILEGKDNVVSFKQYKPSNEYANEKHEVIALTDEIDSIAAPSDVYDDDFFLDELEDEIYNDEFVKQNRSMFTDEEYLLREEEIQSSFSDRVYTIERKKIIDLNLVTEEVLLLLRDYLQKLHEDNGAYEVYYKIFGNLKKTKYKVNKLDEIYVDLLLNKSEKGFDNIV